MALPWSFSSYFPLLERGIERDFFNTAPGSFRAYNFPCVKIQFAKQRVFHMKSFKDCHLFHLITIDQEPLAL